MSFGQVLAKLYPNSSKDNAYFSPEGRKRAGKTININRFCFDAETTKVYNLQYD